jgi:hypothetical protein
MKVLGLLLGLLLLAVVILDEWLFGEPEDVRIHREGR